MLTRSESMNYVTSCHQAESCVLDINISKVWNSLRSFELDKILSSHVKSVKFISGNPNEIGSVFEVEYIDGSLWTNRLLEISESNRVLSWELIGALPETSYSSMVTTIRLSKVTEDNRTFLQWETDYSNDVNTHIVQDGKFKKLDYFKDLKNIK